MNIYHVYEDPINSDGGGCHQHFVRSLDEAKKFIKQHEDGKYRLHNADPEKPTPQPVTWYIQRMELSLDKSNICMALNYRPRDAENFYIR